MRFRAEWIVKIEIPHGEDFDPDAHVEYGSKNYKSLAAAKRRVDSEILKSGEEWGRINPLQFIRGMGCSEFHEGHWGYWEVDDCPVYER